MYAVNGSTFHPNETSYPGFISTVTRWLIVDTKSETCIECDTHE